ncbi:hypothetical protein [Limosilactobacillus reuteri]|uniref:hypothetical protein n=1 Tax=Limosilactobacillus reuteri TaxID=1598 RepID=UPI001E4992B1|nr:hypothetical protein [Limosilactobacillus reuteri]MCC4439356.1 hypothetical protein [Limosilactobacillus reuteri]
MMQIAVINSELLERIKKTKLFVIDKRENFFDEKGERRDRAVNMVFKCMSFDPEISKIKLSIKTKINDIDVGDVVRATIEKASVYALTNRDVPKNTMVPIRVSLKGQLTKVVEGQ